jgi:hypothetical protein
MFWPFAHEFDEVDQILLVGVGCVSGDVINVSNGDTQIVCPRLPDTSAEDLQLESYKQPIRSESTF